MTNNLWEKEGMVMESERGGVSDLLKKRRRERDYNEK
jgi:hypothetical protein